MKIHPDVASLPEPEVVPQSPPPRRLGMLRFERLNESNWALLFIDPACGVQLGLPACELGPLHKTPYASLMEPQARHRLHDEIQTQLVKGTHYHVYYRLHTPRGMLYIQELGEGYQYQGQARLRGYLLPDGRAQQAMPRFSSEPSAGQVYRRAFEQSHNALLLITRDGQIEYANPSFTSITQYSLEEVRGHNLIALQGMESLEQLLPDVAEALARRDHWQGEFQSQRKNREPYWAHLSVTKVFAGSGELTHYIGIYQDITASKLTQLQAEQMLFTDALTGLGNRPHFIRSLEQRFVDGQVPALSLLLLDIDNFKRINDTLGHQSGDKLLARLALRLRSALSPDGALARFASNEFAILLDGLDLAASQRMARQVLHILDKPLFIDDQLINISGSIGVACSPEHGGDPQSLLKHAGLALHKAKANGKGQVQFFTETLNTEANHKLFVENNLRHALELNQFAVFYQPKLCLRSGQLQGMEALLRWNHPEKGLIGPDHFISVAEESGLIVPIGKWVARQACRMGRHLATQGLPNLQMAINLSPRQFADAHLVSTIATILREEQLAPEWLEIELTEGLLLDASEQIHKQLTALKALGVTLAMDDFGTGYSSLSYLKKFPLDVIKIDRSFIRDIPACQDDMEITSAVIAMAHTLRLKVVAEGIETTEQLAFLRRHHCDIGQGYLFDEPIPGEQLVAGLRRYRVATGRKPSTG